MEQDRKDLGEEVRRLKGLIDRIEKGSVEVGESSEFYRSIIDQGPCAVAVADLDGKLLYVNDGFAQLHGYCGYEVAGRDVSVFHTKAQMEAVKAAYARVKSEHSVRVEVGHVRKDGSEFNVLMSISLLKSSKGDAIGVVGSFCDVSELKRIHGVLESSERQYKTLVETMPHGVAEVDPGGSITFSNKAHDKMYGYANGELVGRKVWDMLSDAKERMDFEEYFALQVNDQPRPTVFVGKGVRKDGSLIDIRVDWDYKHDAYGDLVGFVAVVTDVTEIRRAEEAVRVSAEQYRQLVDTVPHGIYELDLTGTMTFANTACHTVLGYDAGELVGRKAWDFIEGEESKAAAEEYTSRAVRDRFEPEAYFARCLRKDGSVIDVQVDWAYKFDEQGEMVGFTSVLTDVTVHKEAQERVERLSAELVIFESKLKRLTPREHEVMLKVAEGLPNKKIGIELDISPRTVEIHRKRVMDKLEVGSVARLVRYITMANDLL